MSVGGHVWALACSCIDLVYTTMAFVTYCDSLSLAQQLRKIFHLCSEYASWEYVTVSIHTVKKGFYIIRYRLKVVQSKRMEDGFVTNIGSFW